MKLIMDDYEKKYKQALERGRQVRLTNVEYNISAAEYIFPELKESEDDKIRKALIQYFADSSDDIVYTNQGLKKKDIIAWLEKQEHSIVFDNDLIRRGIDEVGLTQYQIDWLRSINPTNYFWKPTKEQLEALSKVKDCGALYLDQKEMMEKLYEDLQKL